MALQQPDNANQPLTGMFVDPATGRMGLYVRGVLVLSTLPDGTDLIVVPDMEVQGSLAFAAAARVLSFGPNALVLGATPPTLATQGTFLGLAFDADAEAAALLVRVPDDWDGESDLTLTLYWVNEEGTAIAETETVIWLASLRSRAVGELTTDDDAVALTATYTETGDPTGTDLEIHATALTIDHDDEDQPLAAGDLLSILLSRDKTNDTYAADAILLGLALTYQSVGV